MFLHFAWVRFRSLPCKIVKAFLVLTKCFHFIHGLTDGSFLGCHCVMLITSVNIAFIGFLSKYLGLYKSILSDSYFYHFYQQQNREIMHLIVFVCLSIHFCVCPSLNFEAKNSHYYHAEVFLWISVINFN